MIAAVAVAGWMVTGVLAAVVLGRVLDATETRERREPPADDFEPCTCGACMSVDWLYDQPTDVLSDEAVNARFDDIVGGLR